MAQRPRREDERLHWPIVDPHEIKIPPPPPRDWLMTTLTALTAFTWLLLIGFWLLVAYARPENNNFFSEVLASGQYRRFWSEGVLRIASYLLNAALVLCVAGLILSTRRGKKKVQKRQRMFAVLGIVSLAGSVVSWLLFF